jgi:thiamine pyrophosphokinase
MSSHHIIREDQEPALLIADATVEFAFVQELLEWSPTVIVTEQALMPVLGWGIKIDVVVAQQMHVATLTTSLIDQSPLKLLSYHNPEDALSTALYFLIASKQKAVNIITTKSLESFEPFSSLDISVFQAGRRWSFIRNGHYEKWFPAGRNLRVYPANGQVDIQTGEEGIVSIQRERGFWVSED